jgi:hypothetical protein
VCPISENAQKLITKIIILRLIKKLQWKEIHKKEIGTHMIPEIV